MHTQTQNIGLMQKMLIIVLILALSMSSFLNVAVYAVNTILDNQTSATINKNVKFDTYFKGGNGDTHYLICDVNTQDESMVMELNVIEGYLKQAQIELKDANYTLLSIADETGKVQKAEDNKIDLRQIDAGENIKLGIKIGKVTEEQISLSDLSKESKVILKAVYVDEKGKEIEIEKEVVLNVSWTAIYEAEISSELVKYTNFVKDNTEKLLVQVLTKTGLKESANKLPIKESNINVTIPQFGEAKPEEVIVMAKNTLGTNGLEEGLAELKEENVNKDLENGKVSVKIENIENDGIVWNGNGQDELLFTYIYNKEDIKTEVTKINSKINVEIETYSDTNKVTLEGIAEYDLTEVSGHIVSLDAMSATQELNKGGVYANIDSTEKQYETIYDISSVIEVAYKDMAGELKLTETNTYFTDANGNKYLLANGENVYSYYKTTIISKANFEKILGKDGEISILDENGATIAIINNYSEVNADGEYVVNYTSRYNKLTILTTTPVQEGELLINSQKAISADLPYTKTQAKLFTNLVSELQIAQKENEQYLVLESKEISIPLTETFTNANLVIGTDVLSTIVENENIEIKIELDNSRENTDLYKNGTFKIEFPEYIEDVEISTANILYAEGITVKPIEKQIEDGKVVIYITLDEAQKIFSTGSVTNGTNIILNTNIKTKLLTPSSESVIKMYYTNENVNTYAVIDEETGNGYAEAKINFAAPARNACSKQNIWI